MPDILSTPVPNGTAAVVWSSRNPGVSSLLFYNPDLNNTVYIGTASNITPISQNVIPLAPNGTFSGDAQSNWYVTGAAAGITPLVTVPNGQAYFLGITQGLGNLVIPSVQSPNFVSEVSGWQISKNGDAEFNDVTIRGGEVIDGTTLGYNGTPAFGNMALSISTTGGSDIFGNPYRPGIWIYGTNGSQAGLEVNSGDAGVVLQPPNSTYLTSDPQLIGSNADSGAVNETEWALISSGIASGGQQAEIAAISEAADGSSPAAVWLIFNGSTAAMIITQSTMSYIGALVITGGITANSLLLAPIATPLVPGNNGAEIYSDTSGYVDFISAADNNVYNTGRMTITTTATILINTVAAITILTFNVTDGVQYRFKFLCVYLAQQSAGTPSFTLSGSATLAQIIGKAQFQSGTNGSITDSYVMNGGFVTISGPTMVSGGLYACEAEGTITFSAPGTFTLRGNTSVAADTFEIARGSFFELMPVTN
jgi:hypothetical protein